MPEPRDIATPDGLRDATMGFLSRLGACDLTLLRVEVYANLIKEQADESIAALQTMPALILQLRDGQGGDHWDTFNHMAGAYSRTEAALTVARRYFKACFDKIVEQDRVLTPLRNEGSILLTVASLLADKQRSIGARRQELNDKIVAYNQEAHDSFLGPLDFGLTARGLELEAQGGSIEQELALTDSALAARMVLQPRIKELIEVNDRAQHQRGVWRAIGSDLDRTAGYLGAGADGRMKWYRSPHHAAVQLGLMQDAAGKLASQAHPTGAG